MPQVLSAAQRQVLKSRAHSLAAVVSIGNAGLTPKVLKEIDLNLSAHELIKVRVGGEREERKSCGGSARNTLKCVHGWLPY